MTLRRRKVLFLAPLVALIAAVLSACVPTPPVPPISTNWAGYVVDGRASAQPLKRVAAHFKVPTVTCRNENATLALWVGFDGVFDPQLVPGAKGQPLYQTGIAAACGRVGSQPIYFAWTEVAPAPPSNLNPRFSPVRPGDVFDAYAVIIGSAAKPRVQLQLVNHGPAGAPHVLWNYSTEVPLVNGVPQTAECIAERATDGGTGKVLPLAAFTTAIFGDPTTSGCMVSNIVAGGGQRPIYKNPYGWPIVNMQMQSEQTKVVLVNVSGFTTLKSGTQAWQVAAHSPYFSTPQASDSTPTTMATLPPLRFDTRP
jgi:hypothetical protein